PPSPTLFPYTTLFRSQRGGAHFAAHVLDAAIFLGDVELHVGVRVDQVHLGECTGPLSLDIQLEQAKAMVGGYRGRNGSESRAGKDRKSTRLNSSHVKI